MNPGIKGLLIGFAIGLCGIGYGCAARADGPGERPPLRFEAPPEPRDVPLPPPRPRVFTVGDWINAQAQTTDIATLDETLDNFRVRFGPLPWHFGPDERHPFHGNVTIRQLVKMRAVKPWEDRQWVEGRGEQTRNGETRELTVRVGPTIVANPAHAVPRPGDIDHPIHRGTNGCGVDCDISGYPRYRGPRW